MLLILKKTSAWFSAAGLVFGIALVLYLDVRPPQPPPPFPPPKKVFARGIGASGIVIARHKTTSLGVPVSGLVKKVFVDVWDRVEAGSPLFALDDRELYAQLVASRSQVRMKTAQLDRAREQYACLKAVTDRRAVRMQDLKDRFLDFKVAEADLGTAEAEVEQAARLIERLTVRAPIAGTILQVNIREGEYAPAGSPTPPMLLGNIDDVWVRADVDEQVAPRVRPGRPAVGYIKGDATRPIPLEFVRIEPYVIPKESLTGSSTERVDTRVLQVIYQFGNPSDRLIYVGQQIDLFIQDDL